MLDIYKIMIYNIDMLIIKEGKDEKKDEIFDNGPLLHS